MGLGGLANTRETHIACQNHPLASYMFRLSVYLKLKLDELSATAEKVSKRLSHVSQAVGPLQAEHTTLREELFHIRHTKNKYTDSDKVSFLLIFFCLLCRMICRNLVHLQRLAR